MGKGWEKSCAAVLSELWTLLPLSFLLLCSFLMCSSEHRHMSSLLGVDFGQPLGQEAAASHFTDCTMALLQLGPGHVGKFQSLTLLCVPYFWSFHDSCLQSALHEPWAPTEYFHCALYSCDFIGFPACKERWVKGGLWYELLKGSSAPDNSGSPVWNGHQLFTFFLWLTNLLNTCC